MVVWYFFKEIFYCGIFEYFICLYFICSILVWNLKFEANFGAIDLSTFFYQ